MNLRHKVSRQVGKVTREDGDSVWVDVGGKAFHWMRCNTEEVVTKLPEIEPWVYGVLAAFFLGLMLGAAL